MHISKTIAILVATHFITFLTGYYLCFKNRRPVKKLVEHGIKDA